MLRRFIVRLHAVIGVCLAVSALAIPVASAAAPGPQPTAPTTQTAPVGATKHYATQDPTWLANKMAHRIQPHGRTLPKSSQPSSAQVTPYCVDPCPPSAFTLNYSTTQNVMEPGDGNANAYPLPHLNAPGGSSLDYAGNPYLDGNMFNLCGPGAADNALYYWPAPPNALGTHTYTDRSNGVSATWGSDRYRSYMMRLAWDIQPPGWTPGMMDSTANPSWGVTLYNMRDGLNWEASGENTGTWSNYFYAIRWWGDSGVNGSTLHSDLVADVWAQGGSGVGVVAEVNARLLPNWSGSGLTKHFITIIGYADGYNGGQGPLYYYLDSCGNVTGCGSNTNAGLQHVSQSQMWNAITSVPVNKSTAPDAGDGGWVW